jgi:hypothetical protein
MIESTRWDNLTRTEQRLLIKLFGGGSVRNQDPDVIEHLQVCGLITDEGDMTSSGTSVFMAALRQHKAVGHTRAALAA